MFDHPIRIYRWFISKLIPAGFGFLLNFFSVETRGSEVENLSFNNKKYPSQPNGKGLFFHTICLGRIWKLYLIIVRKPLYCIYDTNICGQELIKDLKK